MNQEAPTLLAAIQRRRPLRVVQLTGDADPAGVEPAYRQHSIEARVERYTAAMPALYAESDFVIACAGGGCLAEIANYALPALLVPLSQAAGNHQADNAREFCRQTGCLWVTEEAWDAGAQAERMLALLEAADELRQVRGRAAA